MTKRIPAAKKARVKPAYVEFDFLESLPGGALVRVQNHNLGTDEYLSPEAFLEAYYQATSQAAATFERIQAYVGVAEPELPMNQEDVA